MFCVLSAWHRAAVNTHSRCYYTSGSLTFPRRAQSMTVTLLVAETEFKPRLPEASTLVPCSFSVWNRRNNQVVLLKSSLYLWGQEPGTEDERSFPLRNFMESTGASRKELIKLVPLEIPEVKFLNLLIILRGLTGNVAEDWKQASGVFLKSGHPVKHRPARRPRKTFKVTPNANVFSQNRRKFKKWKWLRSKGKKI